jgi:hypothetical protein
MRTADGGRAGAGPSPARRACGLSHERVEEGIHPGSCTAWSVVRGRSAPRPGPPPQTARGRENGIPREPGGPERLKPRLASSASLGRGLSQSQRRVHPLTRPAPRRTLPRHAIPTLGAVEAPHGRGAAGAGLMAVLARGFIRPCLGARPFLWMRARRNHPPNAPRAGAIIWPRPAPSSIPRVALQSALGPALRTASGTRSANCSKFFWNAAASSRACLS